MSNEKDDSAHTDKVDKEGIKIAKLFRSATAAKPNDLAEWLIEQEGDVYSARAQLQKMRDLLDQTEIHLNQNS